jgi:hypothetical protein
MLLYFRSLLGKEKDISRLQLLFLHMASIPLQVKGKSSKSAHIGKCGFGFLFLLSSACIHTEDTEQLGVCPSPTEAEAVGIKQVFFSPFQNQQYASSTDTVALATFGFNFELEIVEKEPSITESFPGEIYPTCTGSFTIRNISNISVILLEPFAGLPTGTDISYALVTPENKKLSQLKEFEKVSVYFGTRLLLVPENFSQLKTRTYLFLRDGSQITVDSTSPYLRTI